MSQAFEELIGSHLDELYSAALCFTLDEHRAEELLQEAAVNAFHEFLGRSGISDFRDWMIEALVTTYLERERRRGRDPLADDEPDAEDGAEPGIPGVVRFPEPGSAVYRSLRAWLDRAWSELDAGDRVVLWLADIERARYPRIAEMIGLSEARVRRRHYRARATLSRRAARVLARDGHGDVGA